MINWSQWEKRVVWRHNGDVSSSSSSDVLRQCRVTTGWNNKRFHLFVTTSWLRFSLSWFQLVRKQSPSHVTGRCSQPIQNGRVSGPFGASRTLIGCWPILEEWGRREGGERVKAQDPSNVFGFHQGSMKDLCGIFGALADDTDRSLW